jgi:hypothetical protein
VFEPGEALDTAMQHKAYERFSDKVRDLVARWRAHTARAQTLASPAVASRIDKFLTEVFNKQDTPISGMWSRVWIELRVAGSTCPSVAMLAEANRLIAELSTDLGLTRGRK